MQKKFSYPLNIRNCGEQQQHHVLKADASELKALKEILHVEDVLFFEATFDIKNRIKEHLLEVSGKVCAKLELQSVISLENFTKTYEVPFCYRFDTKATYAEFKEMEAQLGDLAPDIIQNDMLDLADLGIEQLALVMEDYPRQEGETFCFESEFDPLESEQNKPFAVLERLKK